MQRYIFLFIFFFQAFCKHLYQFIILFEEKVKIKIKGPGNIQIIFNSFNKLPDRIYNSKNALIAQSQSQISTNKKEETIIMVWDNKLTSLAKMFYLLENIIEIDFSEFDSSKVKYMYMMFEGCSNVKKIDFTNFQTSEVLSWYSMFRYCRSLTSLNLSSFRTSKNKDFGSFFVGCSSLTSLDLSTFDASTVSHFDYMFHDCVLLTSLNLKNFKMINAVKIHGMFYNCKSLVYLDLSYLDLRKVTKLDDMFYGCNNLKYLNLLNAKEKTGFDFSNIFAPIPKNIIVCIDKTKTPILYEQIMQKNCPIINCLEDLNNNKINVLVKTDFCLTYHFSLDNNNCYENCDANYFIEKNDNTFPKKNCIYKINKCRICSFKSLINNNLCESCNNNEDFYPIENDIKNIGIYHDCYKKNEIKKYFYFDEKDLVFKSCFNSCETCDRKGNHLYHYCLTCKINYIDSDKEYFSENINIKYKNCYDICPYYYYFDINKNKKFCTENFKCPNDYDKLIKEKKECVNNCANDINNPYEFRKECYKECPKGSMLYINSSYINPLKNINNNFYCEVICSEENPFEILSTQECVKNCSISDLLSEKCVIKYEINKNTKESIIAIKTILDSIEEYIISGNYNTSNLDKGKDEMFKIGKIKITLSTLENQKNNEKKANLTVINLNECEKILRKEYKLKIIEKIYIKKLDIDQEGYNIPKINFDVYSKLGGDNLIKLNLSLCHNIKIDLLIPIKIKESLDKINASSGYFNDICYTATSNRGTDITMKDRKKDFIENNKTVCQEECDFSNYYFDKGKAKCSCNINTAIFSLDNLNINKTKLFEGFVDIKNIANINIMKCYAKLFSKKGILKI